MDEETTTRAKERLIAKNPNGPHDPVTDRPCFTYDQIKAEIKLMESEA